MCGIVGFLKTHQASSHFPGEKVLREMNSCLVHRGPDEEGYFLKGPVALGIRRLKIIDLDTGRQPISNEDGTISVVFNGEIYNYLELREDLIKRGHSFKTKSDTEVLVHLYEEEGEAFPRRLRGMFAFALWDDTKKKLLLGRDHFGIKPLFWGFFKGQVLFASEIKALYRHPAFEATLDVDAVDDFLTLLFIPAPKTVYQGLYKLEPGTVLELTPDGACHKKVFWNPSQMMAHQQDRLLRNPEEIKDKLEEKLSESIRMMLRSDVPLGLFLSSGMDSTTVAYFAKKWNADLRTFTIFFPEKSFSERTEAALAAKALGTQHTEIPMEFPQDLGAFSLDVLSSFDEPFGDMSALPTFLLCKAARQHITVALSGDGGDELFGGYPTTIANQLLGIYGLIPGFLRRSLLPWAANRLPTDFGPVSRDYRIKRFVNTAAYLTNPESAQFSWRGAFLWHERASFYGEGFYESVRNRPPFDSAVALVRDTDGLSLKNRSFLGDLKVIMADQYLVKGDRMSMRHSLEVRPALLDPELAELAFAIPAGLKVRGFKTKWILRELMKERLPREILNMPKKGFSPPVSHWLTNRTFQDFLRQQINDSSFQNAGFIRKGSMETLIQQHAQGRVDHTRRLWAALALAAFVHREARRKKSN